MTNKNIKKTQYIRILKTGFIFFPTILLLWIVVELLFFSLDPWTSGEPIAYVLFKESIFWIQYKQHCNFFEMKWFTAILWHLIWLFSLQVIIIVNKNEEKSPEKYFNGIISLENNNNSPDKVGTIQYTFLNYLNKIQLVLLMIGTYVLRFKKNIFYESGRFYYSNILFYLIIVPPLNFLPQFFLLKIYSRRYFQKLKYKRDNIIVPLLVICLFGSFVFLFIFEKICG